MQGFLHCVYPQGMDFRAILLKNQPKLGENVAIGTIFKLVLKATYKKAMHES